jgi:DNA (cytosine-5)-methyltransferase 1
MPANVVGYKKKVTFIDLFAGIGGFRIAFEQAAGDLGLVGKCVFSSEIDEACKKAYKANFNEKPCSDITKFPIKSIPNHDVLLAGFPCQPFSIIGDGSGFCDKVRGTLFFSIAKILESKKPYAFVLENVKRLVGHNRGKTMKIILDTLKELGYSFSFRILNALDFGLPQKRERVFIVGFQNDLEFDWPEYNVPMIPLNDILEPNEKVPAKFFASDYIRKKRQSSHKAKHCPSIWHENKSGNISSYPYSCALRANASYNYLLVNGERRLTPREMLRLQGFPDSIEIVCSDSETRTQAGNSLPVPVAKAVIKNVLKNIRLTYSMDDIKDKNRQMLEPYHQRLSYAKKSETAHSYQNNATLLS